MNILIVDDERVSRIKMELILKCFGRCQAVDSGSAAIKAFTQAMLDEQYFDLISLDVSMPDLGGKEVLELIRKIERTNKIPPENRCKILMVTSHSDYQTVMSSIEAGCDEYIIKPFTLDRVAEKLKKIGFDLGQ